jgi:hypothetical protein
MVGLASSRGLNYELRVHVDGTVEAPWNIDESANCDGRLDWSASHAYHAILNKAQGVENTMFASETKLSSDRRVNESRVKFIGDRICGSPVGAFGPYIRYSRQFFFAQFSFSARLSCTPTISISLPPPIDIRPSRANTKSRKKFPTPRKKKDFFHLRLSDVYLLRDGFFFHYDWLDEEG